MSKKTQKNKPLKKTLHFINTKNKIEIIYYLSFKKMRFGEIKDSLEKITQQLLAKQLKEMERNNLIIRKDFNEFPKKVEYSLTVFGKSFIPIVHSMEEWEKTNLKKIDQVMKKNFLDSIYDYF
jgi:DNA-binding HxlR family transcriptional regulator